MIHRRAPWWSRAQGRLLSSAPQKSRRRYLSTLPQTLFFSRSRRLESCLHTIDPLRRISLSLGLKGAGVAPLPPCSRKLLDETVKTFAVFPSWMHLLAGEDNCILSVPLSTSDLHCCFGKVAKSARECPPGPSRCCATCF